MRSPGRRLILVAAAATLLAAGAFAAVPASAHDHPDHLPPGLQAFDAEFADALAEASAEFDAPIVLAHAGQLSSRDGCHKSKAEGRRHWHKGDTVDAGGTCVKQDGHAWRFPDVEPAPVMLPWIVCSGPWTALQDELRSFWSDADEAAGELLACLTRAYDPRE